MHLDAYLYKEHGKEMLKMFAVFHQEEAKPAHWENDNPLYSSEKDAKDIVNEQPFAWIEFPDDFRFSANKITRTNG